MCYVSFSILSALLTVKETALVKFTYLLPVNHPLKNIPLRIYNIHCGIHFKLTFEPRKPQYLQGSLNDKSSK